MKISKCKFCGFTKPKIEPYTGPKFRVECAKCGSFGWMRKTREEATETWNSDQGPSIHVRLRSRGDLLNR